MKYVKIQERFETLIIVDISFTAKENYEEAPEDVLMFMEKNADGTFFKGKVFNQEFHSDNPRRRWYPKPTEYFDGIVKNSTEQQQKYIDRCNWVKKCIPRFGLIETLEEINNE